MTTVNNSKQIICNDGDKPVLTSFLEENPLTDRESKYFSANEININFE